MTEKLTIITPKGTVLKLDNPKNEKEAREQLMDKYKVAVDKLAHYEDLEEQDRLLVLPEGIDTNKFISFISYDYCVSLFGLKAICDNKNVSHEDCKKCWKEALKE